MVGAKGYSCSAVTVPHQCFMLSQLFISHGKGPALHHHTACSRGWLLCKSLMQEKQLQPWSSEANGSYVRQDITTNKKEAKKSLCIEDTK